MIKPNVVGNPFIYNAPGITTFTNTIIDAIDTVDTSTNISPYCHSATVPLHLAERVYKVADATTDLDATNRVAFGLFISSNPLIIAQNIIYQVNGHIQFSSSQNGVVYPIFGRANSNTIVSDTASVQNTLRDYSILPVDTVITGASVVRQCSISRDVLRVYDGSVTYPYFFGWVIESATAALTLNCLIASLSVRAYVQPLTNYSVDGAS